MLNRHEFYLVGVKETGCASVGINFLLLNLKPDLVWVVVAFGSIVDRAHQTPAEREFRCHSLTKIGGKCGDAALPWKMTAQEGHSVEMGGCLLKSRFVL